jgi:hypothetical protein
VRFQAVDSPALVGPDPTPFPRNVDGGAPGGEAAGDVFKSQGFDPFGKYVSSPLTPAPAGKNLLFIDEAQLGLQAPRNRGTLLGTQEDDLDALEMDSVFSVDLNGDGIPDKPVFFTLDRFSPSVMLGGADCFDSSPDDIFVTRVRFTFSVYADGACNIGIHINDEIDALVLSDVGTLGFLDVGLDQALFSLDPSSPDIFVFGASPADVFFTDFNRPFNPLLDWKLGGSLFASANALGLLATDNLDALDIMRTPEPSSFVLLGIGFVVIVLVCRRKNACLCLPPRA